MRQRKTGTGGACGPLSEILPCARVARSSQDDTKTAGGFWKRKRRQEWMLLPAFFQSGSSGYMCPTSDIFTIASVVKNARSTAPMLMYQHSRSGVSMPGRKHMVASLLCTSCDDAPTTNSRLKG